MIRKIKFNNFYSFKGNQEINFLADKKKDYSYFQTNDNKQITKIASFIGANASGKTNISRLFSFLGDFICTSKKKKHIEKPYLAYKTFFFNKKETKFYIEFEIKDYIYRYNLVIKDNIIQKESIDRTKKEKRARKQLFFLRELNEIKETNKEHFDNLPKGFSKNIKSDISLIAFLKANYNIEVVNEIFDYFFKFNTNINEIGEKENNAYQFNLLNICLKDKKLKKQVDHFIKNFDLGLEGTEMVKENLGGGKMKISAHGIHKLQEKNIKLGLRYESEGTRSLIFTLVRILSALKNESVVIIDEIETALHPEALRKLIQFFIDENKDKRSQLIFTSQSLSFLDKLDMHQIYLIEKDSNCDSKVFRLNTIEGIRSDENFLAKYMSGKYGAFPKIKV